MPTCVICLDVLKSPAALPCGHVFCYDCIVRLVRNVQPYVHQHFCPTCRQPYTIFNSALVPLHLQLHVSPSIRKLQLDYTIPKSATGDESLASECARLRAENASLKSCCDVWCRRAKLHAGTTLGLVGLVRLSRDHAMKLKAEKEEAENKLISLKRTYEDSDCTSSDSDSVKSPKSYPTRYHSPPILSPSSFCPPSPSESGQSCGLRLQKTCLPLLGRWKLMSLSLTNKVLSLCFSFSGCISILVPLLFLFLSK
ncbi:hypothetical protein ABKN59_002041 [Abortiporus biennis]